MRDFVRAGVRPCRSGDTRGGGGRWQAAAARRASRERVRVVARNGGGFRRDPSARREAGRRGESRPPRLPQRRAQQSGDGVGGAVARRRADRGAHGLLRVAAQGSETEIGDGYQCAALTEPAVASALAKMSLVMVVYQAALSSNVALRKALSSPGCETKLAFGT